MLGELSLEVDGTLLPLPKAKKARMLLAYLALHSPHSASRRLLANTFWDDLDPERGLFNLRQLLAEIRRQAPALSPLLLAEDRQTLALDMKRVVVDVQEFRRLVKVAPAEAVELYRGPLLAGLDLQWIIPLRAELERAYIVALESVADTTHPRQAVDWLRRAVEADPMAEPLQQKLLIRLAEAGDFAGMTVTYRRFQGILHRELNTEPSEETRTLFRRLSRAGKMRPTVEVPAGLVTHRLPVPTTPLIGREVGILDGASLLAESRVVTLLGPGGVGKTRLAIAIGEAMLTSYHGGVWFVDLASLSDPELVPQAISQVLGLHERPDQAWLDTLVKALQGPPRMLILDNCEHLIEACTATVVRLITDCSQVSVLATSRLPLGISCEQRFPVEPLDLPESGLPSQDWSRFSALCLFAARAKRTSPKFEVTDGNLLDMVSICRLVDAMPLGIEMAAAALSALSMSEVERRLGKPGVFLKNPASRSNPRHRSLNDVIDWSYSLLIEEDKTLLRRLSVFSGWWSLDHVEVAFGAESACPVLESVIRLVEASLIQMREGEYSLFETVRQFAYSKLVDAGEETHAKDRHLECIAIRYQDVRASWRGPDAGKAATRYEADLDNARLALDWSATSGSTETGLSLVSNAAIVMGMLGLDANTWLARMLALEVSDPGSPPRLDALRTACWSYDGTTLGTSRGVARRHALAVVEELISVARAKGNVAYLGWALAFQGQKLTAIDPDRAKTTLEEALVLNLTLSDLAIKAFNLNLLAALAINCGKYDEACALLIQTGAIASDRADANMTTGVRHLQGILAKERCCYQEARLWLEEARSIAGDNRSVHDVRIATHLLAEMYVDSGDTEMLAKEMELACPEARDHADWLSSDQVELMSRYLIAQQGRCTDATDGLSTLMGRFVNEAKELPSPGYRFAGLGLEILAQCLACSGRKRDAAKAFGAAQAMTARDSMVVSPSILHRWARLIAVARLEGYESEIEAGRAQTSAEAVRFAKNVLA